MNLRKKVFGLAAAAALSLSMVSGAMADDSATGTAVLQPANCSVSFDGSGFNLGSWWWDGDDYAGAATTGSATAKVVAPDAVSKCKMTVSFKGLYLNGDTDSPYKISADKFQIKGSGNPANSNPGLPSAFTPLNANGFTVSGVEAGNGQFTVDLKLLEAPDNIPAGTYQGDLSVTGVDAAQ